MSARTVAGVLGLVLLLGACGVPQRKDTSVLTKPAATEISAQSVVGRYNAVRQRADARLEGSLLDQIEGGDLRDIDQSAYFVSVRVDQPGETPKVRLASPERVISPRFDSYPLWFVVFARDELGGGKRVAVFERADSVSPWRMTMAPETSAGAGLPPVAYDVSGSAITVDPDDATGTGVTPTEVMRRYAAALAPGQSTGDDYFADDAFLERNRRFQQIQESLPFATFRQTWSAKTPEFALRVEGGGMLVFGTLSRRDSYSVQTDSYIDWDDSADTAAYLPGRVYRSAILDYSHEMLVFVPPQGTGKPRLIGQYGGVVDGRGS